VRWFFGRDFGNPQFWSQVETSTQEHLAIVERNEGLGNLLPYVFDIHGPGSRLSVRRDPITRPARVKKKAGGVFYTPADVAEFMTKEAIGDVWGPEPPTFLDPAVGTGVFLRAALARIRTIYPQHNPFHLARTCLFGIDIDSLALDSAAYVLLHDVLPAVIDDGLAPVTAWHLLRRNLVHRDALTVSAGGMRPAVASVALGEIFPSISDGADIVLGNPPYADIGSRDDAPSLAARFATFAAVPRATADLYPIFLEQMVRLGKAGGRGAMVVPLSLACNSGGQFAAARKFIQSQPGTWSFAFFDREPHALFGEDVKTRNAILFWHDGKSGASSMRTGPLRKWRGETREELFAGIDYTNFDGSIIDGVPKFHGYLQAAAWTSLRDERAILQSFLVNWGRTTLDQLPSRGAFEILVGPTAYNFLNIARATVLPVGPNEQLSANPLHRLVAANAEDAACVYAILSSNFAFWWWHINGDGFHVNFSTIINLPIGSELLQASSHVRLAELGERAWQHARRKPVRSLNRGRISFSFPSNQEQKISKDVDALIVKSLGLPPTFVDELSEFVDTVVNARLFQNGMQKN
jgi:hypothetical protein